jgi:hypothetical protein
MSDYKIELCGRKCAGGIKFSDIYIKFSVIEEFDILNDS